MRYKSLSAFTLIELLVVIAIIAVLAVVVILALNPAELLRQARDSNRISDMSTLNSALNIYSQDVITGSSLGSASIMYPSFSDINATSTAGSQCQGQGFPTSSLNYTYHCAASSTWKLVDSTGWLPVNFKLISAGTPIGALPVDPQNNTSTRLYYSYGTDGTHFEVVASMESAKYKLGGTNDAVSTDGGALPDLLEKGNATALVPMDYADPALVGYWSLEEGAGTVAYDYSGSNASGSWVGTATYTGGKVGNYAGSFNGSSKVLVSSNFLTNVMAGQSALTLTGWFNAPNTETSKTVFGVRSSDGGNSTGDFYVTLLNTGLLEMRLRNSAKTAFTVNAAYATTTWVMATVVYNGSLISGYVNGVLVASTAANGTMAASSSPFIIGADGFGFTDAFTGTIDDVRVYNRALSASEVQAIYNSQK